MYALTGPGAVAANRYVHDRSKCGDAFCTVQRERTHYTVYRFKGCHIFELIDFTGRWESHNWGSLIVELRDTETHVKGYMWGGRRAIVNWTPVNYVVTCQL